MICLFVFVESASDDFLWHLDILFALLAALHEPIFAADQFNSF